MKRVYLVGRSGIHGNKELPVESEIIIGRDAAVCQLVYPSSERNISSVHCKVSNINGTVQITDMGSTNGTFLDTGVRLAPHAGQVLQSGQGFYLADRNNAFAIRVQDDAVGAQPGGFAGPGPQPYPQSGPVGPQPYPQPGPVGPQPYPPKPGPYRPQPQGGGKGMSIASLVLGICAIVLWPLFGVLTAIPCGIVGLILGALALSRKMDGRGMAIGGVVCSIVACAFSAIAIVSCMCLAAALAPAIRF